MTNSNMNKNRCKTFNLYFLIIIIIIFYGIIFPQTQEGNSSNSQGNLSLSTNTDYLIGINDTLEIKINDAPELSGFFQVNSQGILIIPNIGSIEAKNRTIEQITEALTNKLKGGYLIQPIVFVKISQSKRRAYFIDGQVKNPGVYQIDGKVTLLKLLTIAGGLTENYGNTANIFREVTSYDETKNDFEVIKINLADLFEGDLSNNIEIQAGDIVQIPITDYFYVTGRVSKPGQIALRERTTFRQAITLAGGLDEKAGTTAFLIRETKQTKINSDEDVEIIEFNLTKEFEGKGYRNVLLQPGDLIQVSDADTFYVVGDVLAPGAFTIPKDGITLRQAISLVKGTKYEADLKKSFISRLSDNGERKRININISLIMKGELDDLNIQANDLIIIPNSRSKTISRSIITSLSNQLPGAIIRGF